MKRAGRVIQTMEDRNMFTLATIDEESRTENLGVLIESAIDMLLDNTTLSDSGVYVDWWQTQIASKDYNGLSQADIDNYKNKVGIGGKEEAKNALLADMQKSAPYFLYLFMGEDWVKANAGKYKVIYQKYLIERNLFNNWVSAAQKILDKQTIYNNLRSGFLKRRNQTPEQFIAEMIATHKTAKVGVITEAMWLAIIAGITSIIIAIIDGIMNLCRSNMGDISNYPSGTPDYYDLSTDKIQSNTVVGNNSIIKYGAIALMLFAFLKKK
jgi:hypothetical protein